MIDIKEIESACERAVNLQNEARCYGSNHRSRTYEDGLLDALNWVCENLDEDPTEES